MKKIIIIVAVLIVGAIIGALLFDAETKVGQQYVSIGTGGVTGVYYPAGSAICRLVNGQTDDHGVRCSVESTGGSVYNLNMVRTGQLDLGIAQSDQQYLALVGEGSFADVGPDENLRSVFSLYTESLNIIARKDANISEFNDLKGKRVNIGNPGSGQRATMEVIMEQKGWTNNDFSLVSELKAAEGAQALCDNKVDAIAYFVGHPNGSIQEATTSCDSVLVTVNDKDVQQLIKDKPYFVEYTIPGGMYRGNEQPVQTLGSKTTLVSSTLVDNTAVYEVVRAVFENIENFRHLHPSFSDLNPENMIYQGNSAPLHPGAVEYYQQAGMLE